MKQKLAPEDPLVKGNLLIIPENSN